MLCLCTAQNLLPPLRMLVTGEELGCCLTPVPVQVQDAERQAPWVEAIRQAVDKVHARDMDARVLDLGAGSGEQIMPCTL